MKVFLSWSGPTSKLVASALNRWLPYMLHPIQPCLSTEISKGERWGAVLEAKLKDAEYGIICLTRSNISKPWLNFESGVLSRFIDPAALMPFLFKIDAAKLTGPLSQFQSTSYKKEDVLRLVRSMNRRLGAASVNDAVVEAAFNHWWNELSKELDAVNPHCEEETETAYEWLYTPADLALHEEREDISNIWIITDNLEKHATKYEVRERLKAKIDKGRMYRFFVPEETTLTDLRELKESSGGRLNYRFFSRQDFYLRAATDYVVVNPHEGELRMFVRLPIEAGNGDDLWFKGDDASAIKFRDRFEEFWKEGHEDQPAPRRASA